MDELDMLQDDTNLEDIVDIDMDSNGDVLPPKTTQIALIDADTIAYTACLSSEEAHPILSDGFYTDKELEEIKNDPQYDPKEEVLYKPNLELALSKAKDKIDRILGLTGCCRAELHFTGGRENFRYEIYPNYKANRTGRVPAGLQELKELMLEHYEGAIHTKWEADDMVVFLKVRQPYDYVLCAVDKDVLGAVVGKHFNYYESSQYNKQMKWQETDTYTAQTWSYIQTLAGDTTDNIIGLNRVGIKTAEKLIANCMGHLECWREVVRQYELKGRTKEEALLNYNLVNMRLLTHTENGYKIQIKTMEEMDTYGK